ncbi:MAG: hypothetical protein KDB22_20580 [Planctomycetales bacterium]|nr:hypothetical protein [Planctomycetales bacterium]
MPIQQKDIRWATWLLCIACIGGRCVGQVDNVVHSPINYSTGMIVTVSAQGAAGVRFRDFFERNNATGNGIAGIDYDWRYLSRDPTDSESTGSGRLFVKLVDHKPEHGNTEIVAGEIHLTWKHVDALRGSLAFDPVSLSLHPVAREYFEARPPPRNVAAVDLRSFLVANIEETLGNKSNPQVAGRQSSQRTAGPVFYDSPLVVIDSSGIAQVHFGERFQRQNEEARHTGLTYRYVYAAAGRTEDTEGQGEVYETYKANAYSGGLLELKPGAIAVTWSAGGPDSGWVYYDPSRLRVWQVASDDLSQLIDSLMSTADPQLFGPLRELQRP